MVSSAAASSRGEAQHTADWLSVTWKKALQKRRNVMDTWKGTKLQPMADELGFWAHRLDNAFPPDMHDRLITLMTQSFDPTKGVSEVLHSKNRGQK